MFCWVYTTGNAHKLPLEYGQPKKLVYIFWNALHYKLLYSNLRGKKMYCFINQFIILNGLYKRDFLWSTKHFVTDWSLLRAIAIAIITLLISLLMDKRKLMAEIILNKLLLQNFELIKSRKKLSQKNKFSWKMKTFWITLLFSSSFF